ncbi:MAG: DUF309 domain-containing protein [Leptolyngbya sp. BL-A-14]
MGLLSEPQPDEFWRGVEQFNQGEFYACHDTLEALWIEATEPDKKFYQGILQIAVALYHLSNQNWRGAVILMGEGMNRLRHYQPSYASIDMEAFLAQTAQVLHVLQQTGPERVNSVIQQLGLLSLPKALAEGSGSPIAASVEALMPEGFDTLGLPTLHTVATQA